MNPSFPAGDYILDHHVHTSYYEIILWQADGLVTLYIHFLGLLPPNAILPDAKFTLRPSLMFSYIGTVTARRSSRGHQPNFAACDKERNYGTFTPSLRQLHSAGRPSRWASAHILVCIAFEMFGS